MEQVLSTITGTPLWVWAVLAYLLFVGLKATQSRSVPIPRLYLVPIILIVIKYKIFVGASTLELASYISAFTLALFVGGIIAKNEDFAVGYGFTVYLPGSYQILTVLLAFFSVKYYFGVLSATNLALYQAYSWIEFAANGLLCGFMLGKAIVYTIIFFLFKKHQL